MLTAMGKNVWSYITVYYNPTILDPLNDSTPSPIKRMQNMIMLYGRIEWGIKLMLKILKDLFNWNAKYQYDLFVSHVVYINTHFLYHTREIHLTILLLHLPISPIKNGNYKSIVWCFWWHNQKHWFHCS